METGIDDSMKSRIAELEERLEEAQQLIDAIKRGEVDAFAMKLDSTSEVFTLQSGDFAYRLLIEEFNEGALNLTESGMIVYTNCYFSKLIKTPYEKIIGSSIYNYLHSQSKEHFASLFHEARTGNSKGEINLEINGTIIPVYISLTSLLPKLPTIGIIITDLTEKKKNEDTLFAYQKQLELKNRELEQRNNDLASFTYAASHDLKEPLRKIEVFSTRIIENEQAHLPVEVADNFDRIRAATKRMQNLIISLLNYSQAAEMKNVLVETDLNKILEEVKTNISEYIQDNGAIIESGQLPVVKIIPDQFIQLFTNIIGNAIKYRKPEVQCKVRIDSTVVSAAHVGLASTAHFKKYTEINFDDNGIGFDQQFASKIFEPFQRLLPKSRYEGTGIGLAICKKIMSNHDGIITAVSKPGVGTKISIYLPVKEKENE